MKRIHRIVLVAAAACAMAIAAPFVLAPSASAHPTPNDRRTAAQCRALANPAKRAACLDCISRARPHHFHPRAPVGARCRPNNGRP